MDGLKAEGKNLDLDEGLLNSYVGKYGPRVVSIENKSLFYKRGNGRKFKLKAISDNEFILEGLSSFRIKFESIGNKVVALIGINENGRTTRDLKE